MHMVRPVLCSLVLMGVSAVTASATIMPRQVSENWSGYAISEPATSFTDVTGTWREPRARCSRRIETSAAVWVGIGGASASSPSLAQAGSSIDCQTNGAASYRLWTEIVPAAPTFLPLKIAAGDLLTAAVSIDGGRVVMTLKDDTHGTRYSHVFHESKHLDTTSAEWIVEAPARCLGPSLCIAAPLANFGRAIFSESTAIGNGHPGTISDAAWKATPIEIVYRRPGERGAKAGSLSADGRSFSVLYRGR